MHVGNMGIWRECPYAYGLELSLDLWIVVLGITR